MEAPLLDDASAAPPTLGTGLRYYSALALLVALTVGDTVFVIVLFDTWGEEFSLFLNQGTALVYIVWSVVLLLVRREPFTGGTRLPILVAIGLLNGSGNFFTAISQPHTPGLSQTLLGLLNIPLVLLLAWLFLGRKPSIVAVLSAALIVGGTAFSSLRTVLLSSGDAQPIVVFGWAITLFGVAQLFLAGEKVFEERVFRDSAHVVRPMQMFFWTLVTQFTLGWGLYPLQTIPQLGGVHLDQLPELLRNGTLCALGASHTCTASHAALFWTYCAVDFWCYFFGLWVIQRGGASLQVLASAIALPLQQLVLCSPIVGKWHEGFFWGDGVALVLVLLGFGTYQLLSPEGRAARRGEHAAHAGGAPTRRDATGEGAWVRHDECS